MKKNILRNSIVLFICLFTTYFIFYNFVSELLTRFMSPSTGLYLGMMVFTTTILYVVSISIINKKISKVHVDFLTVMYFGLTIGLSFFKTMSNYNGINLNPFSIITDFKEYFNLTLLLVVTNTLLYFPLGLFVKFRSKVSNLKLLIWFLLYILIIEVMQYILHRGIFDINDIILNTIGFLIGILCRDFVIKSSIKRKVKNYC
ncbi:VanZ family protein [Clostridium sp.]|uniref:VanZ family protein n=1 Tax=Clostridium sp. TaxID=1506 RepID=UPI001A379B8C|nr:VanZ family protein [Clostridium sp.]MBK5241922.1 VanZ family protein [Clostridium sp.]